MPVTESGAWWRSAAIYQIYPRSFADGNGDGTGDIAGIRARLDHLRGLRVDAIWISPWYPSPMADGGYDVADYRNIDPVFGTLAEAEALIEEAHAAGIRVIVDIVPNHCSDRHPWFQQALAAGPGSPERDRFWFRPGRGESGNLPPNDWQSNFGGAGWRRITEPDGTPGEWYLHRFAPEQPDFNWDNTEVRAEFESALRFWLDRGVDGFRIDVADNLAKDPALPDVATLPADGPRPWDDQDGVHEIYREWRKILDSYGRDAVFVGEVWTADPERFARYLRPDELHTAFNFPLLQSPWEEGALRRVVDATLAAHAPVGATATWVLSNHDTTRHVTRYGRTDTSYALDGRRVHGVPVDLALGTRRARAAALLTMALPGCVYVYQGDELGLWEVEGIPDHLRQDPAFAQSGGTDLGRDGCRVPLPWGDAADSLAAPWLPQPAAFAAYSVAAQAGDPDSMLEFYRRALRRRRSEPALHSAEFAWLDSGPGVLAFDRGGVRVLVNLSDSDVPLPVHTEVLLVSGPLDGDMLPPDTSVWLR
ncbi:MULTISPECIES: glycoside hydrolase family 13 protein [unclassified Streptomyces]|uniref:glycoside hydrolase family 13 protein n=1 Tax=unclassified Streptomyces TaxID=2593676 RepID=UPI0029B95F4C|nr:MULTISPECIES: glycoside hydrolase family 13 protein [unclassified Streptomyces]MDX3769892.1 glycoside hydrolase family 13 protein [Streptomyces sp. AK08-01B]MDX3818715.1 glycoside hydrolase family 13 protein [Streptomyces sp. AK08-01A]